MKTKEESGNLAATIIKLLGSAIVPASKELSRSIEYFLSTGNLISRTGLGLQQV